MNITITIVAPELVSAINNLAGALGTVGNPLPTTVSTENAKEADKPKQETTKKAEAPKKTETPKVEELKKEATPEPESEKKEEKTEPAISLEVVRGKLSEFSSGGKENQDAVKKALSSFGVKKLTDVEPSNYAELLEKVGLSV